MSKAFTQEDAVSAQRGPDRPISTEPAPITRRGLRAMQAELESLNSTPPGEDESAKHRREYRVLELVTRLCCVRPVDTQANDEGRAYFGATVELEDEEGAVKSYQLVGPDEVDVAKGWISVDSPLGRALLSREVGDSFTLQRPKGPVEMTITSVRYEPDA